MNTLRQDAWTKDEDVLLAEIVLRHIRNGRTQLEAFKQAGESLSRTAAACGFRWNATIRKQHTEAINLARNSKKQSIMEKATNVHEEEHHMIESVISLLEKVKDNARGKGDWKNDEQQKVLVQLQEENSRLKNEIKRYRDAWREMKNVWDWIEKKNEH